MLVQEVKDLFISRGACKGIKTDLVFYGGYKQSSDAPIADATFVHMDLCNVTHVSNLTTNKSDTSHRHNNTIETQQTL